MQLNSFVVSTIHPIELTKICLFQKNLLLHKFFSKCKSIRILHYHQILKLEIYEDQRIFINLIHIKLQQFNYFRFNFFINSNLWIYKIFYIIYLMILASIIIVYFYIKIIIPSIIVLNINWCNNILIKLKIKLTITIILINIIIYLIFFYWIISL